MVTWEERFETGFEEIDEQHQSLFNSVMCNFFLLSWRVLGFKYTVTIGADGVKSAVNGETN